MDGRRSYRVRARPLLVEADPRGLFPGDAVIRTVYADGVCLLGAGAALLLQLANPGVAAGVRDHSDYRSRPLDRLIGTLHAMNTVVFGSEADAQRTGRAIRAVHSRVNGPGYSATDPALLCWVNATLLYTAVDLYQRVVRPLRADQLDEVAAQSALVGEVFGCPPGSQPATWDEFRAYWDAAVDGLEVGEDARTIARSLLSGAGLPARPAWAPPLAVLSAVTAALLPAPLRRDYHLAYGAAEKATADGVLGAARAMAAVSPERLRRVVSELLRPPPG